MRACLKILRAWPHCVAVRARLGSLMPQILLDDTDRAEWAPKTFKRQMLKAGILRELRRRRHHVKPSEARRLKSKAAQRARDKARRRQPSK